MMTPELGREIPHILTRMEKKEKIRFLYEVVNQIKEIRNAEVEINEKMDNLLTKMRSFESKVES